MRFRTNVGAVRLVRQKSGSESLTRLNVRRGKRAFTLIEILTVLLICSVLAALLVAGLKDARMKAGDAKCASNLRQIGAAFHMYGADHNNEVPYSIDWSSNEAAGTWFGYNGAYYSRTWKDLIGEYLPGENVHYGIKSYRSTVWGCPSWSGPDKRSPPFNQYCINARIQPSDGRQFRFSQINSPGNTVLVAEAAETPIPYFNRISPLDDSSEPKLAERHGGGGNFLFFDGSVRVISAKDEIFKPSSWNVKPWVLE